MGEIIRNIWEDKVSWSLLGESLDNSKQRDKARRSNTATRGAE